MAIKLKPEHVGTRVLLSDGEVGFVASHDAQANEYTIKGDGFYFGAEQGDERITLLLDAPNAMDVEVPEWCDHVTLWSRTADFILTPLYHEESRERLISGRIRGWSPAPGQLPPREGG